MSASASPIAIRVAADDDVAAIVAIERISFGTPWSADAFRDFLARGTSRVLVAEAGGILVGYAVFAWVLDEAELANIAVAPAHRGRGVGGLLLDRGLDEMTALSVRTVFLEVRAANETAQRLYASRGFVPVGRRPRYYERPTDDALLMRRGPAMD